MVGIWHVAIYGVYAMLHVWNSISVVVKYWSIAVSAAPKLLF